MAGETNECAGALQDVVTASTPPRAGIVGSRSFEEFVAVDGFRLRRVLVAQFGIELGRELSADALEYAWANWSSVQAMGNPAGYLYRVARSAHRWHRRWRERVVFPTEFPITAHRDAEGDIFDTLKALSPTQRTCVIMVHAYQWSYGEVAEVLGLTTGAVKNHVHRGLRRLRELLEEDAEQ